MLLEVDIRKQLKEFTLDVNFSIENSTMGLMGSSGSGKSMTLKCIAGIERPDAGRIVLDGKVLFDSEKGINLPPQERRIGYLFQSYALFPNMSVEENILCGLDNKKASSEEKKLALENLVDKFELRGLEQRYPRQISGGQKQRVALARMLAAEPRVLLFDEPFSALDSDLKQELQQRLLQILKEHAGVAILVSHDAREVDFLAKYCRKIVKGELAE